MRKLVGLSIWAILLDVILIWMSASAIGELIATMAALFVLPAGVCAIFSTGLLIRAGLIWYRNGETDLDQHTKIPLILNLVTTLCLLFSFLFSIGLLFLLA